MSVTLKSYANVGRIVSIAQVLLGSPQEASVNPFAQLSCRAENGRVQKGPVRVGGFLPCGGGRPRHLG